MENNFELKVLNTMIAFSQELEEKGYSVKVKFWGVDFISLTELDAISLKNILDNSFYNVFETLLRENGGSFNAFELEAFAKLFDVTTNEVIDFLNNFMDVSARLIDKSSERRTLEESIEIKMLHIDMERFRINMLKFMLDALYEMVQSTSDEVFEKYDNIFLIEPLEYGGR